MLLPDYALRLLRALSEAAFFATSAGQVLAANEGARAALGLASERPAAFYLASVLGDPPEKLEGTLRAWSRSLEPGPGSFSVKRGPGEAPVTFNAKGSVVFPAEHGRPAIVFVRFWSREEANPFLLLNQKITQLNDEIARRVHVEEALRQSEAALRERAREAEALNRTKDEFLATVSHELRTPLNAILGWSSILRTRAVDADVQKALATIQRNAEAQASIIDDILDVSRIVTGKLLLDVRPSDLAAVIEEAVDVVRPSAAAKQIEITVSRPAEDCTLVADPDRIRQAAWNLLSNAVKFTGKGGRVRASVRREESHLVLEVEDTGQGIEPSFLPLVFDRFKQADSSTTRRVGGLGLGLSLVRHIVELHGGSVEASSEGPAKGAMFTLRLPVRATMPAADPSGPRAKTEAAPPPEGETALRGLRVLVVDDEPDARELLATVLAHAGGQVTTAASVSEAFDAIARFQPDVLVSDIGMPGEDGYSFIRRLRDLGAQGSGAIPSVAVTAYTRAEDRRKALAAGFTTHVGKPVNPDDLVSIVANLGAVARR